MATVVNNANPSAAPAVEDRTGLGMGTLLAVILLLLFVFLFFFYGLPALRGTMSGPSVSVPEQVDVNVQTPQGGGTGGDTGGGQ